jgi:hypothetical protein
MYLCMLEQPQYTNIYSYILEMSKQSQNGQDSLTQGWVGMYQDTNTFEK